MSGAWLWMLVPLAPLLAAGCLAIWRERAIGWLWLACIPALALVAAGSAAAGWAAREEARSEAAAACQPLHLQAAWRPLYPWTVHPLPAASWPRAAAPPAAPPAAAPFVKFAAA